MKWDSTALRDLARACKRQADFEAGEAKRMGGTTAADIFKQAEQRFLSYAAELEAVADKRSGEENKQRLAQLNGSSLSTPPLKFTPSSPTRRKSQA